MKVALLLCLALTGCLVQSDNLWDQLEHIFEDYDMIKNGTGMYLVLITFCKIRVDQE